MYVHDINPVAVSLGPINIHWYGLMYLAGFAGFLIFNRLRLQRYPHLPLTGQQLTDFLSVYGVLGVILGGRIGYVLFYGFDRFLDNPVFLFKVWEGGMSFHGGVAGVLVATFLYCRKTKINFVDFSDFALVAVPIGLFFGRIGNFIGGELWGKVTDLSWGVVFPHAGNEPRHPSQLYEAFLEGIVLWLLLWWLASKPRPRLLVSGAFFAGYGVFRIAVEFVRQPDAHIGYLAYDFVTMGMVLTLPIVAMGVCFMFVALANNTYPKAKATTTASTRKRPPAKTRARR